MNTTHELPNNTASNEPIVELRLLPLNHLCLPEGLYDYDTSTSPESEGCFLPIVAAQSGDNYIIIDGCKRFNQLKLEGKTHCNVILLSPSPSSTTMIKTRIKLNRYRPFSMREKYLFVKWMHTHCDPAGYADVFLLWGLTRHESSAIEELVRCSSPVVDAVAAGNVELRFAPDIDRFDDVDKHAVLSVFRMLSFSRQMQREFLDWLPELAFRNQCTITDLVDSTWMQEILSHPKMNAPQKIGALRQVLFNRRFPTIAKAKKVWAELAGTINPDPSSVQFLPSEAFEKNCLEIKITATSSQQVKAVFQKLYALDTNDWDQLIYPARLYNKS